MPRRTFTVAEVDRLIPSLEAIFTEVAQLRVYLRREEERLERAGVRGARDLLEESPRTSREPISPEQRADLRQMKARFRGFYDALAESLQKIAELGGEVKDLDLGLVDFVGRREAEDILLCWKLGEKRITHWHPIDAGFASRRPIDELVPHDPPRLD